MPRRNAYPKELREEITRRYHDGLTAKQLAAIYEPSQKTIQRWIATEPTTVTPPKASESRTLNWDRWIALAAVVISVVAVVVSLNQAADSQRSADAAEAVAAATITPIMEAGVWPHSTDQSGRIIEFIVRLRNAARTPALNASVDICLPATHEERFFATLPVDDWQEMVVSAELEELPESEFGHIGWEVRTVFEDSAGDKWRSWMVYDPTAEAHYAVRLDRMGPTGYETVIGSQVVGGPCELYDL